LSPVANAFFVSLLETLSIVTTLNSTVWFIFSNCELILVFDLFSSLLVHSVYFYVYVLVPITGIPVSFAGLLYISTGTYQFLLQSGISELVLVGVSPCLLTSSFVTSRLTSSSRPLESLRHPSDSNCCDLLVKYSRSAT